MNKTIVAVVAIVAVAIVAGIWLHGRKTVNLEINGKMIEFKENALQVNEDAVIEALKNNKTESKGYKIIDGVLAVPITYEKTALNSYYKDKDGKIYLKDCEGKVPTLPINAEKDGWIMP